MDGGVWATNTQILIPMTLLEKLNATDRFARANGVELTFVGPGVARAEMDVSEDHLNGGGVCQGGAIFTLADLAFAAVSNSGGFLTLGVNNSISFLSSAVLGDHLVAEAREDTSFDAEPTAIGEEAMTNGAKTATSVGLVSKTVGQTAKEVGQTARITGQTAKPAGQKKLPHATVRVTNQDGTLIAVATGLAYRKRDVFPFDGLMP